MKSKHLCAKCGEEEVLRRGHQCGNCATEEVDINEQIREDAKHREVWQQLMDYCAQGANGLQLTGDQTRRTATIDITNANKQAMMELDCMTSIVRLRSLLARHKFGVPWDFSDFAHWFLDAFRLPIIQYKY